MLPISSVSDDALSKMDGLVKRDGGTNGGLGGATFAFFFLFFTGPVYGFSSRSTANSVGVGGGSRRSEFSNDLGGFFLGGALGFGFFFGRGFDFGFTVAFGLGFAGVFAPVGLARLFLFFAGAFLTAVDLAALPFFSGFLTSYLQVSS